MRLRTDWLWVQWRSVCVNSACCAISVHDDECATYARTGFQRAYLYPWLRIVRDENKSDEREKWVRGDGQGRRRWGEQGLKWSVLVCWMAVATTGVVEYEKPMKRRQVLFFLWTRGKVRFVVYSLVLGRFCKEWRLISRSQRISWLNQ